jgi:hypothetical protein
MSSRLNDKREAEELLRYLHDRGVMVWRDDSGDVNVSPASGLTATVREELGNLKGPLRELLEAEETVVIDPVEQSHSDMRTPPAPELSDQDKLAASLKASRRGYQGGQVVVNGQNAMGGYMRLLREQREASQAAERGEIPPAGRYRTQFNPFE